MKIGIVVREAAPASVVTGLYEHLSLAFSQPEVIGKSSVEIEFIAMKSTQVLQCGAGVSLHTKYSLADLPKDSQHFDVLIVAPIGPAPRAGFEFDRVLLNNLKLICEQAELVASVCTGAFLLAATGLMNGRKSSTHWLFEEQFRRDFPKVLLSSENLVVEDEKYLSSGGSMAYLDMTLRLIEKLLGRELALRCAKLMVIAPDRITQSEFAEYQRYKRHGDTKVLDTQAWIEENYQQAIDVVALAERACLSERHFKRRFKAATSDSPSQYWQRIRIDKAKRFLEASQMPIENISVDVGYEDVRFFRTLFKRFVGITPIEYRKRYKYS